MQVFVQKCLDKQKSVFACFIDYEKTFNNVQRMTSYSVN